MPTTEIDMLFNLTKHCTIYCHHEEPDKYISIRFVRLKLDIGLYVNNGFFELSSGWVDESELNMLLNCIGGKCVNVSNSSCHWEKKYNMSDPDSIERVQLDLKKLRAEEFYAGINLHESKPKT